MPNNKFGSRTERQMKRRKNERLLLSFVGVAVLFVIILFIFIFTGKDENKETDNVKGDNTENNITTEDVGETDEQVETDDSETEVDESEENDFFSDDVVIQQIDSNDSNVIEAFVGNWPPIGTIQEEPHTTEYDDDSQDRIEIREAILNVTNIKEDDLTELWVGNGGDQKVIANVEDRSNSDIYRIYLSWVEAEGWQVTLVERIKEFKSP